MTYFGSEWRHWDLHLHAPGTLFNDEFASAGEPLEQTQERYVEALESLGPMGALGITDYCVLDSYHRMKAFADAGRLANIGLLLPNIELRAAQLTKANKPINIHILVDPDISQELDSLLFSKLEFPYMSRQFGCTRDELIRLGRAFREDKDLEEGAALRSGAMQFKVELSHLWTVLDKSRALRDGTLLCVANSSNDGASGIQDDGMKALRQQLYRRSHMIFSGNPNDREHWLGKSPSKTADAIRSAYRSLKPCVHGSDAHSLGKVCNPDEGRTTWIKADPTFEGLRQILFEPEYRVYIGSSKPRSPVHRIRLARIDFPSSTMATFADQSSAFCLRSLLVVPFAAGLTCIIGGRGSGKSTLLNVIHEAVHPADNEYFQDCELSTAEGPLAVRTHAEVEFLGDQSSIEFISQNQIVEFALAPDRLTSALYSRLKGMNAEAPFEGLEKRSADAVALSKSIIARHESLAQHRLELDLLETEDRSLGNLITSTQDKAYVDLANRSQDAQARLLDVAGARSRLAVLLDELDAVLDRSGAALPTSAQQASTAINNAFQLAIATLVQAVTSGVQSARDALHPELPSVEEAALASQLASLREELTTFLLNRGLSDANLKDLVSASERLAIVRQNLDAKRRAVDTLAEELKGVHIDDSVVPEFVALAQAAVERMNARLRAGHAEMQKTQLAFKWDAAAASQALLEQLGERMKAVLQGRQPRLEYLDSVFVGLGSPLDVDDEALLESLKKTNKETARQLEVFLNRPECNAFWRYTRLGIRATCLEFMRLDVEYEGRALASSSFGQKCAAVLILLLSLGNNPVVIDEPEAHLDSALIATFLVELIKDVKQDRQIIFATHNANFVVNGDAELVHVLHMDAVHGTLIESTSLENLEYRNHILALEGGPEAFRQREDRYGLAREVDLSSVS